ncbi:T9SS type A sorting domain-containing protein [Flavobacterium sp.]|uniref:T9SS type A sorting domain-containing protein n=1 Tax=Flavobacterium sp. TaxID=239 RepID=UPI0039E35FBA
MRKIALLLVLLSTATYAQKNKRFNTRNIASVDTEAPIGLDLMGGDKEGVTVFPNETNDHILISVAGKASEKKSIVIYNQSGQRVFTTGNCRENTYMVDVSGLRKDLYFIEIMSGSNVYRKKWMRS